VFPVRRQTKPGPQTQIFAVRMRRHGIDLACKANPLGVKTFSAGCLSASRLCEIFVRAC
jgi:hypothetical protein